VSQAYLKSRGTSYDAKGGGYATTIEPKTITKLRGRVLAEDERVRCSYIYIWVMSDALTNRVKRSLDILSLFKTKEQEI
jgi:hypothetical protein